MFIGHFGVGFAAKEVDSKPSLGTLFIAAQFLDLLWPLFLLFGIEKVKIDPGNTAMTPLNFTYYPYSHSLLMAMVWAVLFGGIYFIFRKNIRGSLLLGGLVVSHWILDFFVHRPDLPLWPGSDFKVGLGLWNSVAIAIILESLIFIAGVTIYLRVTHSKNKTGTIALWALLIFLILVYVMNIFGPPPDAVQPIAILGLSQWLLVAWAYWIDRNRSVQPAKSTGNREVKNV